MRSSIVVVSALLAGALARPRVLDRLQKREVVVEMDVEIVTVIVTVTATPSHEPATATSSATSTTATPSPKPEPESSSSEVKPTPSPTPSPEPSSSSTTPASSSTSSTPKPNVPLGSHISGPRQAKLSSGPEYQAAILYHHNAARANHDATPLVWDRKCEDTARLAAERCIWEHYIPEGAAQGQNLFAVSGDFFNATGGVRENWYNGEMEPMMPYFGQASVPDEVFHAVGHLTQMVWKETTKVGCVSFDCEDRMIMQNKTTKIWEKSDLKMFTVCNYAPYGNVFGAFAENVSPPAETTIVRQGDADRIVGPGKWSD